MAALDYIDPDLPDYPSLPYRLTEDGFAVEDSPPYDPDRIGGFSSLKVIDVYASEAADFAITKFNELKGTDLKVVKVVRGNWVPGKTKKLMEEELKKLMEKELKKLMEEEFKKTDGEGVEETDGGDRENHAQGLVEHKRLKRST